MQNYLEAIEEEEAYRIKPEDSILYVKAISI
jgi:hypothetical protein